MQAPHVCVVWLQVSPLGQVPQLTRVPHWFSTYPQVAPSCAQVLSGTTQVLVERSQVWVATHAPQSSVPPQPSP